MNKDNKNMPARIAIMDSDTKTAEYLTKSLHEEGYDAESFVQTTRMLQRIKDEQIDVLILAVEACGIKGYELIPTIKKMNNNLPIIVTSADDSIEVAAKVREQGVFFYAIKPLDVGEIKLVLANAFNKKSKLMMEKTETIADKTRCPFFEELCMVCCNASRSRKMLPKDQLVMQNPCEGDFKTCPIFKEFLINQKKEEIMSPETAGEEKKTEKEKPCIWMKAGVIPYRMCTTNYDCENCEFDQAIMDQSGPYAESPSIAKAIEKLRQLPAPERICRYTLTGDISARICSQNYECWHCELDQLIQDSIDANSFLRKRKARMAKRLKKIRGFIFKENLRYLPNHIWIKVEGETLKIGIDNFATRLIGKIDEISFPNKNVISRNTPCWSLGRVNRIVNMSLPMDAEIVEKNEEVLTNPEIIQKDSYNRGWLLKIKSPDDMSNLLKDTEAIEWLKNEFDKLHQELEDNAKITIADGGELVDDICEQLTDKEWHNIVKRFLR